MECIKLIIDIPEEDYKRMKEQSMFGRADVWRKAIQNGTQLPKVHGRLIILSENRLKENQINLDWSCQKWISEVGLSNATVKIIKVDI